MIGLISRLIVIIPFWKEKLELKPA